MDNELYENARANVQEENQRRQETIKTLNEYGLYFMQRGLNSQEFQKIKIISYKPIHGDMGFTRCSICLNDFHVKEKLKSFPGCDHIYHIKCLDIWLNIEPTCPNCLKSYIAQQNLLNETGSTENMLGRVHPSGGINSNINNNNANNILLRQVPGAPLSNLQEPLLLNP